jgi:D-sedoheptulose 7-phosphate isomerase
MQSEVQDSLLNKKNYLSSLFEKEFKALIIRYPQLSICKTDIFRALEVTITALETDHKILTCGNGGSCADAEHIVGELIKGFVKKRIYSTAEIKNILPFLSAEEQNLFENQLQKPIRAISLMGHPAYQTAFGNDKNFEFAIAQHLLALGDKNDVMIAISTSGNSKNIIRAVQIAKAIGVQTILLTGDTGGKLSQMCDICIKVPSNKVHEIQELHLPIYHFYCYMIEFYFFN